MIPKKIKIGFFVYEVIETDEIIIVDGKECGGSINFNELIIRISNKLPYQRKVQVLWHEIIHGIHREFDVQTDKLDEETITEWTSVGLVNVLRDNPKLYMEVKYDTTK